MRREAQRAFDSLAREERRPFVRAQSWRADAWRCIGRSRQRQPYRTREQTPDAAASGKVRFGHGMRLLFERIGPNGVHEQRTGSRTVFAGASKFKEGR
jgi:hypothetical protein